MSIRRNPRTSGDHYHEFASRQASREYPRKALDYDGQLARRLAAQFRRVNAANPKPTNP